MGGHLPCGMCPVGAACASHCRMSIALGGGCCDWSGFCTGWGYVEPPFRLPCDWVLFAGLVRAEDFAVLLLGLLDLRRLLGPPPALAGSGKVKLSSKVPPI